MQHPVVNYTDIQIKHMKYLCAYMLRMCVRANSASFVLTVLVILVST